MKTIKVSTLSGAALDWAVAKCEGFKVSKLGPGNKIGVYRIDGESWHQTRKPYNPSTEWEQGGPIIQREFICVSAPMHPSTAPWWAVSDSDGCKASGPTPLIAAMRCYVANKLGDEVEIPDELAF